MIPFIISIFSPILSLLLGLSKKISSKNIEIFFIVAIGFYGLTMIMNESADGFRHLKGVYEVYEPMSLQLFITDFFDILILRPRFEVNDDLFIHILSFLAAKTHSDLFFGYVGLVYGYFFVSSLFIVFRFVKKRNFPLIGRGILFWTFVLLILWKFVEGINTVRTWTGMWFVVFMMLKHWETQNKKYLFFILFSPFFHIAYFIFVVPIIGSYFLKNYLKIAFVIFVLSFGTNIFSGARNIINVTPEDNELVQSKVDAYYDDGSGEFRADRRAAKEKKDRRFYAALYRSGLHLNLIFIVSAILFYYESKYRIITNLQLNQIFAAGLLLMASGNILFFLSDYVHRAFTFGGMLVSIILFILVRVDFSFFKILRKNYMLNLLLYGFSFLFLYQIMNISYFTGVTFLLLPPLSLIFPDLQISIRELLN